MMFLVGPPAQVLDIERAMHARLFVEADEHRCFVDRFSFDTTAFAGKLHPASQRDTS